MQSRQATRRSTFPENALCSPSLDGASQQAKGSRGSAENPGAWGKVGEVFMECGGAVSHSVLREAGEDRELSGYTPQSHATHLVTLSREESDSQG